MCNVCLPVFLVCLVCLSVDICKWMRLLSVCMCIYTINTCMHACMYKHTYIICMYTYVYMYIHASLYIKTWNTIYIYTHTYPCIHYKEFDAHASHPEQLLHYWCMRMCRCQTQSCVPYVCAKVHVCLSGDEQTQASCCMYVRMYVCIHLLCTYIRIFMYIYIHTHVTCTAFAGSIYKCRPSRSCVCARVRAYMYIYICIYIYTHTYVYIYGLMLPVEPALAASMRAVRPSTSSISTDAWCSSSTCLDKWCVRMYACMDVCTHGSMCLCTYFCTCVVMHMFLMRENCIYVYVCDHIHTYIVCS
jgi:hypothetical protein